MSSCIVTTLLVEELSWYFWQYLDTLSDGPSAVCDVTESEKFQLEKFLAVSATVLHTFACKLMKSDRFFPFLWFLCLSNSGGAVGNNCSNYDRVWKLRRLFVVLNDPYWNYYLPSKRLTMNELMVLFKGKIISKQYIPKNTCVLACKFASYVTCFAVHMVWMLGEEQDMYKHTFIGKKHSCKALEMKGRRTLAQ